LADEAGTRTIRLRPLNGRPTPLARREPSRVAGDPAGEDAAIGDARAGQQQRLLDAGAGADRGAGADHERAGVRSAGADLAAVAEQDPALDFDIGGQIEAVRRRSVAERTTEPRQSDRAIDCVQVSLQILGERADVVPVGLDLVHVERHVAGEQGRKHIVCEVDRIGHLVAREVVEDLGAEGVDHAVTEVGERLGRVGLLLKALDPTVGAGHDHPVLADVGDLLDAEGRDPIVGAVSRGERGQVGVGECVAGEDEEVVAGGSQEVGDVADPARGAEQLLLVTVGHLDAERRAVAEPPPDLVGEPVQVGDHLIDAVRCQQADELLDDRDVADRDHRLRDRVGDRPEPRAEPGCHDHRPHGRPRRSLRFSITSTGVGSTASRAASSSETRSPSITVQSSRSVRVSPSVSILTTSRARSAISSAVSSKR
jgi:hypothetical protein